MNQAKVFQIGGRPIDPAWRAKPRPTSRNGLALANESPAQAAARKGALTRLADGTYAPTPADLPIIAAIVIELAGDPNFAAEAIAARTRLGITEAPVEEALPPTVEPARAGSAPPVEPAPAAPPAIAPAAAAPAPAAPVEAEAAPVATDEPAPPAAPEVAEAAPAAATDETAPPAEAPAAPAPAVEPTPVDAQIKALRDRAAGLDAAKRRDNEAYTFLRSRHPLHEKIGSARQAIANQNGVFVAAKGQHEAARDKARGELSTKEAQKAGLAADAKRGAEAISGKAAELDQQIADLQAAAAQDVRLAIEEYIASLIADDATKAATRADVEAKKIKVGSVEARMAKLAIEFTAALERAAEAEKTSIEPGYYIKIDDPDGGESQLNVVNPEKVAQALEDIKGSITKRAARKEAAVLTMSGSNQIALEIALLEQRIAGLDGEITAVSKQIEALTAGDLTIADLSAKIGEAQNKLERAVAAIFPMMTKLDAYPPAEEAKIEEVADGRPDELQRAKLVYNIAARAANAAAARKARTIYANPNILGPAISAVEAAAQDQIKQLDEQAAGLKGNADGLNRILSELTRALAAVEVKALPLAAELVRLSEPEPPSTALEVAKPGIVALAETKLAAINAEIARVESEISAINNPISHATRLLKEGRGLLDQIGQTIITTLADLRSNNLLPEAPAAPAAAPETAQA